MVIRAGLILATLSAMSASGFANTVHQVRFVQSAQVVVWQDDLLIGQGASVRVLDRGAMPAHTLPGSGRLETLSHNATGSEGQMRLRVASNAGFTIEVADPKIATQMRAEIQNIGANASAVAGQTNYASGVVFEQLEKTALRRGSHETQAIELELTWTGAAPSDLRVVAKQP